MGCSGYAQDALPVDSRLMLEMLKQIKEKRASAEKALVSRVAQNIGSAASSNSSALAFYQQAVMATQYDGKTRDQAEFQNWLRDNGEKFKSEAVQSAIRLHLSYLLLTLQRAGGATTRQMEPALLAHITAIIKAGAGDADIMIRREHAQESNVRGKRPPREPLFWEQELIRQGVEGAIFVQWFGIQKLLSEAKEWEMSPGNIDGMYQKTLLPFYRQTQDARAIAYWDDKLQKEAQAASGPGAAFKIDQFNQVRRPQLLWKRAQEYLTIGQRNRGTSEMMNIIRSYPDHPDLPGWIQTAEALLSGAAPAAPSDTAAPASE